MQSATIIIQSMIDFEKLGGAMPLVALTDDKARGNIEGSEQRGCPMPDVIVRPTFGDAWQDRLFAVQGLDLAFFVYAENKRPVGRRELAAVRLQAGRRPHSANLRVGKAGLRRHRTDRPVCRVGGVVRNVRSITAAT